MDVELNTPTMVQHQCGETADKKYNFSTIRETPALEFDSINLTSTSVHDSTNTSILINSSYAPSTLQFQQPTSSTPNITNEKLKEKSCDFIKGIKPH